ncbi:MAG: hypothetical protein KDD03_11315, partial [Gelidibacter sp.]|nr:hypothetical protein [Gelidibacter sp.]
MGNAISSKQWSEKMYINRDIEVAKTMNNIQFNPFVTDIDIDFLLKHFDVNYKTTSDILKQPTVYATKIKNYVEKESFEKKYISMKHIIKDSSKIERGRDYYHMIIVNDR